MGQSQLAHALAWAHADASCLLGLALVLLGFVLPFLLVLRIIEPSFLLSFLSYGASITGLILGLIGAACYVRINRG